MGIDVAVALLLLAYKAQDIWVIGRRKGAAYGTFGMPVPGCGSNSGGQGVGFILGKQFVDFCEVGIDLDRLEIVLTGVVVFNRLSPEHGIGGGVIFEMGEHPMFHRFLFLARGTLGGAHHMTGAVIQGKDPGLDSVSDGFAVVGEQATGNGGNGIAFF